MANKLKVETIVRITLLNGKVIEGYGESPRNIPTPGDFDLETPEGFLNDLSLKKALSLQGKWPAAKQPRKS